LPSSLAKAKTVKKIQDFVAKNGRIPVKRELWGIYKLARREFGTWNNAIESAGFEPNPVLFAKKHKANDGHICDSLAEKIIDDWLSENNVEHQIHVPYPNSKMSSDFLINGIRVEFFGLQGEVGKYDRFLKRKRALCQRKAIKMIAIYPNNLFPQNNLGKILHPLLE